MKKFFVGFLVTVMTAFGVATLSPTAVHAAANPACDASFLTFRPWYYGLTVGSECKITMNLDGSTEVVDGKTRDTVTENEVVSFVWAIVLNVLSDIFSAVGYLAIGFLIYGGYIYILARGDPARIAKGKKIVMSAIFGLVICILAAVIVNTIVEIMIGAIGA